MSELLRRFRYGLSYFGLASLCALAMASQRSPHELGFAPRLVLNLTLPLERMVTMPLGELRGVWGDYVALVGVREDNERGCLSQVHRSQQGELCDRERGWCHHR